MRNGKDRSKGKNKTKWTLNRALRYRFENRMMGSTATQILLLVLTVVITTLIFGVIFAKTRFGALSTGLWKSIIHILNPSELGMDTGSRTYLFFALVVTVIGMLLFGELISILNVGMSNAVARTTRGRTKVMERNPHILILGYSDATMAILEQLVTYSQNSGEKIPLVIMTDEIPASDLAEQIERRFGRKSGIVCRSGCIHDIQELNKCSVETARGIIIDARDDFETIEAIMACNAKILELENEGISNPDLFITATVRNTENELEAKLAGGERVKLIPYTTIMARILAGASRETGMSYVYRELSDYRERAIDCVDAGEVCGKAGKDIPVMELSRYLKEDIAVGGVPLKKPQADPDDDHPVRHFTFSSREERKTGDYGMFFVLRRSMKSEPSVEFTSENKADESLIRSDKHDRTVKDRSFLYLGGGALLDSVLKEQNDFYKSTGKRKVLVADIHESVLDYASEEKKAQYPALDISAECCDIYEYKTLKRLVSDSDADSVVLLADPAMSPRASDEKNLSQAIYLKQIRQDLDNVNKDFAVTCEMGMENTMQLASLTGSHDFVVGERLTAVMSAQIAVRPELHDVLVELMSSQGSGIYMRPITDYLDFKGQAKIETDVYTISEAVARSGEIFIGFHRMAYNATTGEIEYNAPELIPPKWETEDASKKKIYSFWEEDELVIISDMM